MKRAMLWLLGWGIVSAVVSPGCMLRRADYSFRDANLERYNIAATEIEYPDVATPSSPQSASALAPITIPTGPNDPEPAYWNLSLEEAVQTALQNSSVLRDLGGLVLQSPGTVRTVHGPAIQETDPRFGVDAALAAFDTSYIASAIWEANDRALNNQFFGGGTRTLKQDLHAYRHQLTKKTAYGTELTARQTMDYDANNAPGNQFFSAWTTFLEAEFRQPLLQGMGTTYNRIAGPGAVPGVYNGVLIARINTDISLAEFELGVRNMVNDVETAYWELYFAYRDLDTKIAARDRALETWRTIQTWKDTDLRGGEADKEAQAREQYYRLEEEVQNAVSGRLEDRIRVTVFRGQGGVQQAERRLRLLMGVSITDGRLIRPDQDPRMVEVLFTWEDVLSEALTRREELRRQKWLVKRREMELLASRNFLYPQLDALGRYRWRGFGKDLLDPVSGKGEFDNAFADLVSGDFQEWQLGVELNMPIGSRKAHAAVHNAQLNLARERAVLDEQEREVVHDLSNAIAEMKRAYTVAQTNYNRRVAAEQQLKILNSNFLDADGNEIARLLDLLLDAQRRLSEAESKYFRSMVEYEIAVKNVHYQKGSLLEYNEVFLSEGSWPAKAYDDAARRATLRGRPWELRNFVLAHRPPVVAQPAYGPASAPEYGPVGPGPAGFDGAPQPGMDVKTPPQARVNRAPPSRIAQSPQARVDSSPLAKFEPAPRGGFDHTPPGRITRMPGVADQGPAPPPVRLSPEPSREYLTDSPENPSLAKPTASPVVRLVPTDGFHESFDEPALREEGQAAADGSGWDAQPASHGAEPKSRLPRKLVPFGNP